MKPTNGWYNGNDVDWDSMGDPEYPAYGRFCPKCSGELHRLFQKRCPCGHEIDWDGEGPSSDDEDQYYGLWKRKGRYWSLDRSGDFSAIFYPNDNEFRVVWSKTIRYGHHGSPCIPGQVHVEPGDTLAPPPGVEVIEIVPGKAAPYGRWYVSPYYALPDDCIRRRENE